MYHISKDKRAVKSAELIWKGLVKCLIEKPINKIRISDIKEKSYISRATFYRLFDSIEDVLTYRCDLLFEQVNDKLSSELFSKPKDMIMYFIDVWINEKDLIKALADNNMISLIYDTYMKHSELFGKLFAKNAEMLEAEADYLVSMLASMLPAAMNTWYIHGQKESSEEIYYHLRNVLKSMNESFV